VSPSSAREVNILIKGNYKFNKFSCNVEQTRVTIAYCFIGY